MCAVWSLLVISRETAREPLGKHRFFYLTQRVLRRAYLDVAYRYTSEAGGTACGVYAWPMSVQMEFGLYLPRCGAYPHSQGSTLF